MVFQGTIKSLVEGGLYAGSMKLGQPELSVLTRYWKALGWASEVQRASSTEGKRTGTVWRIEAKAGLSSEPK